MVNEVNSIKFGMLTVLDEYKNEKGYTVCGCLCECGNVKVVYKSNLSSGRTRSCGCLEEENRRKFNDIKGRRFGRLLAVAPTDRRLNGNIVWKCVCDCGNDAFIAGRNLIRGYTKSCGCYLKEKRDISGQRFGKLVAVQPDESSDKGPQKWVCICDCGKTCSVSISNLRNGHTQSCGCLAEIERRTMIDGTCLEMVASDTLSKNNRSGVRGVSYYSKTDSWVATITFKGKRYYLGRYKVVQEAANARRLAEERLIEPFIEEHRILLSEKRKYSGFNQAAKN